MLVAAPDCEFCMVAGLRACDVCGTPIWNADDNNPVGTLNRDGFGRELCPACA